jgi:hypothetical protein
MGQRDGARARAGGIGYTPAVGRPDTPDLLGATRLALDAVAGLTDVVEAMHATIARGPLFPRPAPDARTRGITGLVYGCIRGATALGGAITGAVAVPARARARAPFSRRREALVAAVNGVVGDHLADSGNPLAIPMRLRRGGRPLVLDRRALGAVIRRPRRKLLMLVHGACRSDLQWRHLDHDHGAALARALGYTAVYLHYNTGRHVSENGRDLAALLEQLVGAWPVEPTELAILAHSMGGLVARSACHQATAAGLRWPRLLRRLAFLGTPHHGAPLERGGSIVDVALGVSRYSAPLARLGRLRSAGVTDLRFGSVAAEDWRDRDRFGDLRDRRTVVPLPDGVRCYAIAGSRGRVGAILGDGLVSVESALGRHRDPALALGIPDGHRWIARGAGHLDLLGRPDVYDRLWTWFAG